jgi:hypothetical protein
VQLGFLRVHRRARGGGEGVLDGLHLRLGLSLAAGVRLVAWTPYWLSSSGAFYCKIT